jgi:hypothetical protein
MWTCFTRLLSVQLSQYITNIGLDPRVYKLYGFRIGVAGEAAVLGNSQIQNNLICQLDILFWVCRKLSIGQGQLRACHLIEYDDKVPYKEDNIFHLSTPSVAGAAHPDAPGPYWPEAAS